MPRVFKLAWQNFVRNIGLSATLIIILVSMFFSFSVVSGINLIVREMVNNLRNRVDLSLYLKPNTGEEKINILKTQLQKMREIQEIKYVSPEEALIKFKNLHAQDNLINKSLEELDKNPLGGTILIKVKSIDDYETVRELLRSDPYQQIIQEMNFYNYEQVITQIDQWGIKIKFIGFLISGILILIVALVVFNAVRLSIYARQEEIKIMRLVGATAGSIRRPFILEITFSILLGWIFASGCFLSFLYFIQPKISDFLNFNFPFTTYILNNLPIFFGPQLILAFLVCVLSASWAMRKYLEV
ncbi:MAG: permease-like cell division protein FtsX [Patescibacteria group bacterium]